MCMKNNQKGAFVCNPCGIIWQNGKDPDFFQKQQGEEFLQPFWRGVRVHEYKGEKTRELGIRKMQAEKCLHFSGDYAILVII